MEGAGGCRQVRLLMIWTAQRSKNWPDVPTMQELGYSFVFDSPFWATFARSESPH
jgi:tripartite-type tricarboxylate transporter receptor subunit TctC